MRWIVIAVGLAAIGFAGIGLVRPPRLLGVVRDLWLKPGALYLAVAIRVALGVALIMVAPTSRFPDVFYVLGLVILTAAIIGLVLGTARLGRFIEWWLARPEPFIRTWSALAIGFGVFLIYGVV